MRTSSEPARASAATCATVASTSAVSVLVIDWTTIGAPPPTTTPPTRTATLRLARRAAAGAPAAGRTSARHAPASGRRRRAAMRAAAGDLEHLQMRLEALGLQAAPDSARPSGAEDISSTPPQPSQIRNATRSCGACWCGQATKALRLARRWTSPSRHQELERPVDGDRRELAAPLPGERVGDVVGAERAVRRIEHAEHVAADRRQPRAAAAAGRLGRGERVRRAGRAVRRMGAAVVAVAVLVLEEVHDRRDSTCPPGAQPGAASRPRTARDGDFCAAAS